ncbi:MAG: rRNA methyltransferase [Ilumatobacteraceae bacterium]|nr:rRNA methyltransferase [Ilumatobacteraceae bacterium]
MHEPPFAEPTDGVPGVELPSGGGPLVYVEDLEHPVLRLDDHHHLARVRRVRNGDPVILGDGTGSWRSARMHDEEPEPDGGVQYCPHPTPTVGVAFALVKGSKPELAVQKLTELGVDWICPFEAARSVVRWDEGKADLAQARLNKVAREAAMQSRQPWLPRIEPVTTFAAVAGIEGACLAERSGDAPSLHDPVILVGPEGGWDRDELGADLPRVSLSTGVLRAETAAIVAGALLVALRSGRVVSPEAGRRLSEPGW